jgi:hypothetical protein
MKLPIPFPIKGLSENYSFDIQEPGTTRDLLNVRAIDPKTGRTRGAQRSGLARFLDDQLATVSGAPTAIQEIVSVPINKTRLAYTTDTTPDRIWTRRLKNKQAAVDVTTDDFGNLYALQSEYAVFKYNQDGGLIGPVPERVRVPRLVSRHRVRGREAEPPLRVRVPARRHVQARVVGR